MSDPDLGARSRVLQRRRLGGMRVTRAASRGVRARRLERGDWYINHPAPPVASWRHSWYFTPGYERCAKRAMVVGASIRERTFATQCLARAMNRAVAFVMEQTLGNNTHYLNLRCHEGVLPDFTPRWLPVQYRELRLPWTITGSLRARLALGRVLSEVDAFFMHTATLAPLTVDYFNRKPAFISTDGTPLNKRGMRGDYGLGRELPGMEHGKRLLYRELFSRARGFVAWSNWVKQSFVEDYGCPENDVAVIPPGIDVDRFTETVREHELPRILFVGGDFERKGGSSLLRVFRQRFRGQAELVLVTRAEIASEPGVTVHRGVAPNSQELLKLYAEADVFALPTRADCYSLVCMEALACGLPVVATRVGGIPDILREGETGHLLDVGDDEQLGDALESLIRDPARRVAMGKRGRADALERFTSRGNARRLFEFVRARS